MERIGCVLLTGTLSLMAATAASARETMDFDFGWRFAHGPILGAEAEDFYDGPRTTARVLSPLCEIERK